MARIPDAFIDDRAAIESACDADRRAATRRPDTLAAVDRGYGSHT
ncbi:hypothetical protein [Thermomonas alba]|nr:hypothetical protein [Thermomonas alba]